jgi:hypothetical protein
MKLMNGMAGGGGLCIRTLEFERNKCDKKSILF